MKILILEDDSFDADQENKLFSRAGADVEVVMGDQQIRDAIARGGYDFVVSDGLKGNYADYANLVPREKFALFTGNPDILEKATIKTKFDKGYDSPRGILNALKSLIS